MASAMMWAVPKELILKGNFTANYNTFEEPFKLLERTELVNKSEMEKVSYSYYVLGNEPGDYTAILNLTTLSS